jgi:hypothetical protein
MREGGDVALSMTDGGRVALSLETGEILAAHASDSSSQKRND